MAFLGQAPPLYQPAVLPVPGIVQTIPTGQLPVGYSTNLSQFTPLSSTSIPSFPTSIPDNAYTPGAVIDADEELEPDFDADGKRLKKKDEVPIQVDSNYNLDSVLSDAILRSEYFKQLYEIKTYHEVLDEIKNEVHNLEPYVRDFVNVPSTAFTLLYKLFTMRLTTRQLHGMIQPKSPVFVRGIGFLYIRVALPPQDLWKWMEQYLEDEEEIVISTRGEGKKSSIGKFVKNLLLDYRHLEIFFKRLPLSIKKDIETKIAEREGRIVRKIDRAKADKEAREKKEREQREMERLELAGIKSSVLLSKKRWAEQSRQS